jgi:hypothetical protein
MRATLRLSSPAWLAQPKITSSTAAQSIECGIGQCEDHSAMRGAVRVGHVLSDRHAKPGISRRAILDHQPPGVACAFLREHMLRDPACEPVFFRYAHCAKSSTLPK